MKPNLNELEALQKQKYTECKIDFVPASLKEIRSAIGDKEGILVARELIIDNRVLIGIEYSPEGKPVGAYTTDEKGRRIAIENSNKQENKQTSTDVISRRLENAKSLMHEEQKARETTEPKKVAKPVTKKVTRPLPSKNIEQLKEFKNSHLSK